MNKIYLKLIARRLRHDRGNSLINLLGLSIALSVALLVRMYVLTEWQTDRALPQPERTYRLLRVSSINEETYDIGVTSAPFATALQQDFPANIDETVRVVSGASLVEVGEQRFQEEHYYYADANFLAFFGYELSHGDAGTALAQPHSVVLTAATAARYFGSAEAAMGQTLRIDNDYDARVAGVLEALDHPTHMDFDLIESTVSLENAEWWSEWWNNNLCTYVRLNEGVSASAFETQLPAFMDKYFGEDFARTGRRLDLRLQSLRTLYFEADTRYDPMRHGSLPAMRIFLVATLLLVFIAVFNYVNLLMAKTVERSVEVGVYKALGSERRHIVIQVLGETGILTTISLGIAVLLALYMRTWFEQFFEVSLDPALSPLIALAGGAALIVLLTILAGLYPGLLLSSFQPVHALKGISDAGDRTLPGLRRVLVVLQFVFSIGLLCCTFVIQQQMGYLREANLGFDREQVLLIRISNPELSARQSQFRDRLQRFPGVQHVSISTGEPGGFHDASTLEVEGIPEVTRMRTVFTDFDYVSTFGLEIVAGRDFSESFRTDSTEAALLNEFAVNELGLTNEEVIGRTITNPLFDPEPRRIVGVVKNYNFSSLHDVIEPLILSTGFRGRVIAVKVQGDRVQAVIEAARETWESLSPAYPFTYSFLDDRLDRLYAGEVRQSRIFGLFAGIAIFIACLGILGLATHAAARRSKEIGIRKVLGASVVDLVVLLSKSFLTQVLLAALVAIPVAYLVMQRWLDGFAYHVEMGAGVFIASSFLAALVALTVVSYRSARAALANPVETLRYE